MTNVAEELPDLLALDELREEEAHLYKQIEYDDGTTSTQEQYTLNKAPVLEVESVVGIVDDKPFDFTVGTDYEVVACDSCGRLEAIDFSVGGESPDPNTEFTVQYVARSVLIRYIQTYDDELSRFQRNIEYAIDSHHPSGVSDNKFIDDFEQSELVEYIFQSGFDDNALVQNDISYHGDLGLQLQNETAGSCTRIASTNGLRLYPQRGETIEIPVRLTGSDDELSFDWLYHETDDGVQQYYRLTIDAATNEVRVQKDDGASKSSATSAQISQHLDEWLIVTLDTGVDTIEVSVETDSGTSLGTTSIVDTQYSSGGIRIEGCNAVAQSTMYVDAIRVLDRRDSDLDRIGALFGELGRRRGRPDDDYATFLRSIVQSFSGRGTLSGIVFAVASGYRGDEDDVSIVEDFQDNSYTIRFEDPWPDHTMKTLVTLAQLADPSGVELAGFEYDVATQEQTSVDDQFSKVVATNTSRVRWDAGTYDDTFVWDGDTPGDQVDIEDEHVSTTTTQLSRSYQWDTDSYDELQWNGTADPEVTTVADLVEEQVDADAQLLEPDSLSTDATTTTINKADVSVSDITQAGDSVATTIRTNQWNADTWSITVWAEDPEPTGYGITYDEPYGSNDLDPNGYGQSYGDNYGNI